MNFSGKILYDISKFAKTYFFLCNRYGYFIEKKNSFYMIDLAP